MSTIYLGKIELEGEQLDDLEAWLLQHWLSQEAPNEVRLGRWQLPSDPTTSVIVHRCADPGRSALSVEVERPFGTLRRTTSVTVQQLDSRTLVWLQSSQEGPDADSPGDPDELVRLLCDELVRRDSRGLWSSSELGSQFMEANALSVIIAGEQASAAPRLMAAVRDRILGMSPIFTATGSGLGVVQRAIPGIPVAGGSILVLRPGHSPLHLPPTLVRKQPGAVATRIQRACLDEVVSRPGDPELLSALGLPGMPHSGTAGGVDEDVLLDDAARLELERTEALESAAALRKRHDDVLIDLTEALQREEVMSRRLRYVEQRLTEAGDFGAVVAGEAGEAEDPPSSCAEALARARESLPHILVTARQDSVTELDSRPESIAWAQKTWMALSSLNDYAEARSSGKHKANFMSFCTDPHPGALVISPGWVALVESQSTRNDPTCTRAREFPVPEEVRPQGMAYMEAHIKIQKVGTGAPRLHFLDDTANSGHIVVGYVGPHLPLAGR